MQKILLLGGSGYLGQRLIRLLTHRAQLHAVVRSPEAAARVRAACPSVLILDGEAAEKLRFDRIFNLVVDYGRDGASLMDVLQANLLYPLELLDRIEAEVVINVSTALPRDYSNYALSKKLLEQALHSLEQRSGRAFVNVQLHNMYGPGAHPQEFIQFVARRMLAGDDVDVSDCANSRDFIFVDDAVRALSLISDYPERLPRGEPVEVGSGQSTCLRDVLHSIRRLTGSDSVIRFGAKAGNPREPARLAADTSVLRHIGWVPLHSLEEGLTATINAFSLPDRIPAAQ